MKKESSRGVVMAVICFALLVTAIPSRGEGQTNGTGPNVSYGQDQLQYFVTKYRETVRFGLTHDVSGLLNLMLDEDPWVRSSAGGEVARITNLRSLTRQSTNSLSEFDAWDNMSNVVGKVTYYQQLLADHSVQVLESTQHNTAERVVRIEKRLTEQSILFTLLYMAHFRVATTGRKDGIYVLKAMLDHPDLEVVGRALANLQLRTMGNKADINFGGPYDSVVVNAEKQEWLAWWATNEATLVLPVHQFSGG